MPNSPTSPVSPVPDLNTGPPTPTKTAWWRELLIRAVCIAVFALAVCVLAGFIDGTPGVEKSLTAMCFPVGLAWLLVCGTGIRHLVAGRLATAMGWLLIGGILTAIGTAPLRNACYAYVEGLETPFDPSTDPHLDLLVVLGGGTTQGPTRAQAASSGDRVVYAAELYHGGHARRLITTGGQMDAQLGDVVDPSCHTREIWQKLNIPAEAIETLEGINTSQELHSVSQLPSARRNGRVGILTSAFHLPRAMRLARAEGLELIPVAADYRVTPDPYMRLVPSAGNIMDLATLQHEFMAYCLGR